MRSGQDGYLAEMGGRSRREGLGGAARREGERERAAGGAQGN